jgi:protoheme IX farnesyltransferase
MKTETVALPLARPRAQDFLALAKPRLNFLVVASALAGYAMAGGEIGNVMLVLATVVGTALVAGGASAFNQVIEREPDSLMRRTEHRPIPDGRVNPLEGTLFAAVLSLMGLAILAAGATPLASAVALTTLVTYVVIYTPLKRRTSFSTVIGAVPGALPPVIGWAAAQDNLSPEAWVLFWIVFLWQLPHFLAIAWIYREDYGRAGFPMLPVIEPDGRSTGRQAVIYTAALLPIAMAPTLMGMSGKIYFVGAFALTAAFLMLSIAFARTRGISDARKLFFGSILYLPVLWILMIVDRV